MTEGSVICQLAGSVESHTPNMIGAMLRRCFPVAEKPTIVKIPPSVGPLSWGSGNDHKQCGEGAVDGHIDQ